MHGAFKSLAARFPPPQAARADGLLCVGGDLRPERLLAAYSQGIFPWYEEGLPILWWTPDPRCVLPLSDFRLPRRSARALRLHPFELTLDAAFEAVIRACAGPRRTGRGTWLSPEMIAAYEKLHALGFAHSVEAWQDGRLAGGLYGVGLGRAFFGESMFHVQAEASRAALAGLVALLRLRGALLLDCQQETPHIMRMGGLLLPRAAFLAQLAQALNEPQTPEGRASDGLGSEAFPWSPWKTGYVYSVSKGSWTAKS